MKKNPRVFHAANRFAKKKLSLLGIVLLIIGTVTITAVASLIAPVRSYLVSLAGGSGQEQFIWQRMSDHSVFIFTVVMLIVGFIAYARIEYQTHRKPLEVEDPLVIYTFPHHLKVVTMPLLSYKWHSITKSGGFVALVMIAFIATTIFTGMFTRAANNIGVTINHKEGSSISAPVFTVEFSRPIVPETFTPDDIKFEYDMQSPASSPSVVRIDQVAPNDNTTFEVTVTADSSGNIKATIPAAQTTYESEVFKIGENLSGLVSDSQGNTYSLTDNREIIKIADDGTYSTFAEVEGLLNSGGFAIDVNDNLYVITRPYDYAVAKITPDGLVSEVGQIGGSGGPLTVDGNGNIYIANSYENTIEKLTPEGVLSQMASLDDVSHIGQTIAADNDGNAYLTQTGDNYAVGSKQIRRVAPNGDVSVFFDPNNGSQVDSVIFGSDGYIYCTNGTNIWKISTTGVSQLLTTTQYRPVRLASDNSGNIYSSAKQQSGSRIIYKTTPSGETSELTSLANDVFGSEFSDVSVNINGNVFTLREDGAGYYRITPSGTVTKLGIPGAYPVDAAIDNDGNIYTYNAGSNNVTKTSTDKTVTVLASNIEPVPGTTMKLHVGRDNNVYIYTAAGHNTASKIIRVTQAGVMTNLDTDSVSDIEVDVNGNVYTVYSNTIVKITPDNQSLVLANLETSSGTLELDDDGNLYTANGSAYKTTPDGTTTTIGDMAGSIRSLVHSKAGNLYGLNHEGKVYRVTPDGTSTVIAALGTAYYNFLVVDEYENAYARTQYSGNTHVIHRDGSETQLNWGSYDDLASDSQGYIYKLTSRSNQVVRYEVVNQGAYDANLDGNLASTSTNNTAMYIGTITDLKVKTNSNTAALNWDNPNVNYSQYSTNKQVQYKKVSEADWKPVADVTNRSPSGIAVYGLEPGTEYNFRVRLVVYSSPDDVFTDWAQINGTTTEQVTIQISDCDDLQAISVNRLTFDPMNQIADFGDMSARYELTNDIDCAESANWTWLEGTPYEFKGFLPLLAVDGSTDVFSGILDGNGFTISNLQLSNPMGGFFGGSLLNKQKIANSHSGLFPRLRNATITDLKIEGFNFTLSPAITSPGQSSQHFNSPNIGSGLLAGEAIYSSIDGVSVDGNIISLRDPYPSGPAYHYDTGRAETLDIDSQGNSYVLNNGYIRKINPQGKIVKMWGAHNETIDDDLTTNFMIADFTIGSDDVIYVLSTGFATHGTDGQYYEYTDRVQRYDTEGNYLGAFGSTGTDVGQMYIAAAITASDDYIFVLDSRGIITRFNYDGNNPVNWDMELDFEWDDDLNNWNDLFNGNVLSADNNGHVFYLNINQDTVYRYNADGSDKIEFSVEASVYFTGPTYGNFTYGSALGLDASGNVYVSSPFNLQRFDNDGNSLGTLAANLENNGPVDNNGLYSGFSNIASITKSGSGIAIFYNRWISPTDNLQAGGVMRLDQNGTVLSDFTNNTTRETVMSSIGGLIGNAYSTNITGSSSTVDINIKGTDYDTMYVGGLVGLSTTIGSGPVYSDPVTTQLKNNYYNGSVKVGNGGFVYAGGLYGGTGVSFQSQVKTQIENSYSAGTLKFEDAVRYISTGGISGYSGVLGQDSFKNTFSTMSIEGQGYQESDFPNLDFYISSNKAAISQIVTDSNNGQIANNYYDKTASNLDDCMAIGVLVDQSFPTVTPDICAAVNVNGTQPNYFKFNRSNPPLNTWNFTDVWRTNEGSLPSHGLNTPPSPPRQFTGNPSSNSITLTWQPPESSGGRPIVNYIIQYRKSGTTTWQTLDHAPSLATSYLIEGLEKNTTYEFQVAAVNEIGESEYVLAMSIITENPPDDDPPDDDPQDPPEDVDPTTDPRPNPPRTPRATPIAPTTPNTPNTPDSPAQPSLPTVESPSFELPTPEPAPKQTPGWEKNIPNLFVSLLLLVALAYALMSWWSYRQNQSLQRALITEQKNNQNIKQFVAIVSHYLGTPLAILKGASEIFKTKKTLAEVTSNEIGQEINNLEQVVSTTIAENEHLQTSAVQATTIDKNDLVSIIRSKQLWIPLLTTAVTVAIIDTALVVSGGYHLSELRVANSIVLYVLFACAVFVGVYMYRRQKSLNQHNRKLLDEQKALSLQKTEMLSSVADQINGIFSRLNSKSAEIRPLKGTDTYFNGLRMLEKLSVSLSNARAFAVKHPSAPVQNINDIVTSVSQQLDKQVQDKNITLVKNLDPAFSLQAQPEEARFLIGSLLENAVKFSPPNGRIELTATSGKHLVIKVVDHGSGIAEDKLQALFQPFERGSATETYDYEGMGLGLYTNKLLVEKLGGTLQIANHKPGGVTATITLPKTTASSAAGMTSGLVTPQ